MEEYFKHMIISRCHYCHHSKSYDGDFKIPTYNIDSEFNFKCDKCKRTCALMFYTNNKMKGGNEEMAKEKEVNECKSSKWNDKKEDLIKKIVIYAKQVGAGESNERIRSTISGAYKCFNLEINTKKNGFYGQ